MQYSCLQICLLLPRPKTLYFTILREQISGLLSKGEIVLALNNIRKNKGGKGNQSTPSQNVPLWHKNDVELKTIKNQETQEKLPIFYLKAENKFFFYWRQIFIIPERSAEEAADKLH